MNTRPDDIAFEDMASSAQAAADMLRALSHETRLMILCMLAEGEKSVNELKGLLDLRQSSVSQQLTRLKADRLVHKRRDGKFVYYSLASNQARAIIDVLYDIYCRDANEPAR